MSSGHGLQIRAEYWDCFPAGGWLAWLCILRRNARFVEKLNIKLLWQSRIGQVRDKATICFVFVVCPVLLTRPCCRVMISVTDRNINILILKEGPLPLTWSLAWPLLPFCSLVSSSVSSTNWSSGGSVSRGMPRLPSVWSVSQRDWGRPSCWRTSTRTPPWRTSRTWRTRRTKRSSLTSLIKLSVVWTN